MTPHVSVAGGSPAWRRGIKSILEEAGHRVDAFDTLDEWKPGVGGSAVVIRGDSEVAAESVRCHTQEHPHIPAIAVVEGSSVTLFARWVRVGASAVVDELDDMESLPLTVSVALQEKAAVPTPVLRSMAEAVPSAEMLADRLSDEEVSWLRAMAEGRTVIDLAESAGYSERAMFRLLRRLYVRLGVPNRTGALMWASRVGLLSESSESPTRT